MFWFFARLAVVTAMLWTVLVFSVWQTVKWAVTPDPVAVECKLA
jgi:hypothetical protein